LKHEEDFKALIPGARWIEVYLCPSHAKKLHSSYLFFIPMGDSLRKSDLRVTVVLNFYS
jgi:hypothetical protein